MEAAIERSDFDLTYPVPNSEPNRGIEGTSVAANTALCAHFSTHQCGETADALMRESRQLIRSMRLMTSSSRDRQLNGLMSLHRGPDTSEPAFGKATGATCPFRVSEPSNAESLGQLDVESAGPGGREAIVDEPTIASTNHSIANKKTAIRYMLAF